MDISGDPVLLYCVGFAGLFFVPGFLISVLFGFRRFRFLLSVAFSYALLLLNLLVLQALGAPVEWFLFAVAAETGFIALACVFKWLWRGGASSWNRLGNSLFGWIRHLKKSASVAFIALLAVSIGYLVYAEPYTEIPSEGWKHLNRIERELNTLNGGENNDAPAPATVQRPVTTVDGRFVMQPSLTRHLFAQGRHWYFIQALLLQSTGVTMAEAVKPMTFMTVLFFLTGAYFFGLFVFSRFRCSKAGKSAAALLATAFLAMHLGTNVFAYIRYYALAPDIINYVLYFAGAALFVDFLVRPGWNIRNVIALAFVFFTANAVHTQEALFIYFICMAAAVTACWRALMNGGDGRRRHLLQLCKTCLCAAAALVSFFAVFGMLRRFQVDARLACDRLAVPVQTIFPFLRNFLVLPPWGQFYETLTLWGLFVYLIFVIKPSPLKRNVFMMGGMLIPLFTVFNPFVVDMAARYDPLLAHMHRLVLCVPVHFAAGWFGFDCARKMMRSKTVFARMVNAVVLALLILLLFPFQTRYVTNDYSRWPTITETESNND